MKSHSKIIWILVALIIFSGIAYFIFQFFNKPAQTQTTPPGATQISTQVNYVDTSNQNNRIENLLENRQDIKQNATTNETTIAIFETVIGDNSAGRVKNIELTCSTLNETVIQPGETFSFNQIVGNPTAERGYQEAKIIVDHKTTTGIGGGNCQVSSTLYNTVLQIASLTVLERHEHGKDVYYVPEGKDAAVSYGGLDFKFRNDTGKPIKIGAITDGATITTSIIQIG